VTPGLALRYSIEEQPSRVTRLAWSPDGRSLAVPSRDGVVRVHDAESGALQRALPGFAGAAMGVAWSPDGRYLVSIAMGDRVRFWNASTGRLLHTSDDAIEQAAGVAWSPCGRLVAVASEEDDAVFLWNKDHASLSLARTLRSAGALHIAWSPDGTTLVVGSRDGRIRVWDPWVGRRLRTLSGHEDAAVIVAWAPDGAVLASGSKDGTIHLWRPAAGRAFRVLTEHRDHVTAVAVRFDGQLFASKSRDGSVRIWRPASWEVVAAIAEPSADIGWSVGLAFHPTAPMLATLGPGDAIVRIWDIDLDALPTTALDPGAVEALLPRPCVDDRRSRPRAIVRLR
jgi:WD40 repeat protein